MGRGGLPTGILRRGAKLYVKVRMAPGKWSAPIATGLGLDEVDEAVEFRQRLQARIDAGFTPDGPLTVRAYATKWLEKREDLLSYKDEESRMRLHVIPHLGHLRMEEVRPRHLREWLRQLRTTKKLEQSGLREYRKSSDAIAPRTIRNVYSVVSTMFHDAVVDEVIRATPAVLKRGDLPRKRDRDPEWRAGAIFTRAELEQIISDDRIPQDRRMLYALMFLTSSRFGEAAALRWRLYDPKRKPLGRIVIARSYNTKIKDEKETKTEAPRRIPVHPVLAKMLAAWRLSGWEAMMGRKPTEDDLIVPSRLGKNRSVNHGRKKFHADLERIGLRTRRQHDTRRTFKSIALDDGANPSRLRWITHGRPGDIDGAYDEPAWAALCECVELMRIYPRNQPTADLGAFGAEQPPRTGSNTEQGG